MTPRAEASLGFFADVLGMEVEAREGQSVFLRGWGDYQPYSLKLTESGTSGMGWLGIRTSSPEALARRIAAAEASGLGEGWSERGRAIGASYRVRDPDGHAFELYYESERYRPPPHLVPSLKNQPQRYVGRGAAVKRLDHVNVLAADVRANRVFATDVLGYRLYERVELDDGTEAGAWLSATIAGHELVYTADFHRARGRLHHLAFWGARPTSSSSTRSRSRRLPRSTRSPRASSSTASSRAATASRSRPAGASSTTRTPSRSCGRRPSERSARPGG